MRLDIYRNGGLNSKMNLAREDEKIYLLAAPRSAYLRVANLKGSVTLFPGISVGRTE